MVQKRLTEGQPDPEPSELPLLGQDRWMLPRADNALLSLSSQGTPAKTAG
uniref:Testis cDNA clone: QtsA-14244, similar to human nuclear receptor subfamily 1, group I, member 2 (NR1I2),transcript variant 1 n=1 Tax=Macaca fascicularis TaxID=9541 RepID=Q4R7W1_MACFA|nr:unnamed protein product [Macaca fascicularis]